MVEQPELLERRELVPDRRRAPGDAGLLRKPARTDRPPELDVPLDHLAEDELLTLREHAREILGAGRS